MTTNETLHQGESLKTIFRKHIIYTILSGLLEGAFYLNEFVLIKSLKGSNYQVAFFFQSAIAIMLFSIFTTEITKRFNNKKLMLRWLAVITHLPLLGFAFYGPWVLADGLLYLFQTVFLMVFLVYYSARPILYPAITAMLKRGYGEGKFGRYYGYTISFNKIAIMVATLIFGLLLDVDEFAFVWVYPILGVLGIGGMWVLSSIPYSEPVQENRPTVWQSVKVSLSEMKRVIGSNATFRDYQIGFMLYGLAWMITMSLVTIFFERELHLNYTSVAMYKNAYNVITILIVPFFSRRIDRIDPRTFASLMFFAMFMHLFFMGLTIYFPQFFYIGQARIYYMLVLSYISFAVFTAAMGLAWNVGSSYFCDESQAAHYQSVHLTLVGVRAALGPQFGVFMLAYIGFEGVIGLGMLLLLAAIFYNSWSVRNRPIILTS